MNVDTINDKGRVELGKGILLKNILNFEQNGSRKGGNSFDFEF